MIPFDLQLATRIVFGPDRVDSLGEFAQELRATRVLLVSDAGVIAVGHTARGVAALRRAGLATCIFDQFQENPTSDDVQRGLELARVFQPDVLVGLGGGSSLDCAKGINFLYTNGGRIQDYWGVGKARQPLLPMLAVPTTAGTGSEAQSFALISDAQTKVKMACGDKKAAFRVAILDPKLTLTQPRRVTALAGIDAISHALETFVTTRRNAASLTFSREAWRLLASGMESVLDHPGDLEARSQVQLGACFAGLAIEHSMLGAAHALANPLTTSYGIPHGEAVGLMLPHVIRFNGQAFPEWYAELCAVAGRAWPGTAAESSAACLAGYVASLLDKAGFAKPLSQRGICVSALPELAAAASQQWTGSFNPRPVDAAELQRLYQLAF